MRFGKDQICLIRALPRHTEAGQRAVLEPDGCGDWIALHERDGFEELIGRLRRGDTVKLARLRFLAPPKLRTSDNPRRDLWRMLHAIEDRGAIVREVSTGRATSDPRQRDMMIADAIEEITRGSRAISIRRARENGKLGGRPPKVIKPVQREAARSVWLDPSLYGDRLRRALRREGYSLSRCYREFGPRHGRD